jgi:hypothetical protein
MAWNWHCNAVPASIVMCARNSASYYSLTWIMLVDAVAKLKRARAAAAPVPIVLAGDDYVVPAEADLVGEIRIAVGSDSGMLTMTKDPPCSSRQLHRSRRSEVVATVLSLIDVVLLRSIKADHLPLSNIYT